MFAVVRVALVVTQLHGKHISVAVNQHATIEEVVFSVGGAAPRLYKDNLTQLRDRIQRVSGVGSWQNNRKKGIGLCKEDFIVCCSCSETVMNLLPGYD
jgi:hypothetical protein